MVTNCESSIQNINNWRLKIWKTNVLLNLINHKLYTDKIYLYAKNPYETKFQFLINKCKNAGLKDCYDFKSSIEYSNDMDDIYEIIDGYNPNIQRKILIIFDHMIAYVLSNKKNKPIVTELFIRCTKLNISLVFIIQSYYQSYYSCTKKY